MKNIFKLMGIAVLTAGMFAACGDKEGNEGEKEQQGGDTPTATIKVNFNGTSWDASVARMYTGYAGQYGLLYERIFKEDGNYPYVDVMHGMTPGSYTITPNIVDAQDDNGEYNYVDGYGDQMDLYGLEYGEKTQVQQQNGAKGDWDMLNAKITITAADANALTASYDIDATMYDFYSWNAAAYDDVKDEAHHANLTVKVNSYKFDVMQ